MAALCSIPVTGVDNTVDAALHLPNPKLVDLDFLVLKSEFVDKTTLKDVFIKCVSPSVA